MKLGNIFENIPKDIPQEMFNEILRSKHGRIERIISKGHSTPAGKWYDQDKDEMVLLLKGSAGLLFEGQDAPVEMKAGDYLCIPAHRKHRVAWTDGSQETIWLAVHYDP